MTKEKMRKIRREFICEFLRKGWAGNSLTRQQIRLEEFFLFGYEMRIY